MENLFDLLYDKYKIEKPIRLIELFSGYGSQALALKYLGIPFEHYMICEWAVKSIQAYKDIHFKDDNTDYSKDFTKEELVDKLFELGISLDYNKPATKEQIKRQDVRTIYNNIIACKNKVNVCNAELDTKDLDKYEYILTYSYPCQSISLSGLRHGMEKGSGTRSSMLWQVERMLERERERELEDGLPHLPQILIMENVPQAVTAKGWEEWNSCLENLGYTNYCEILNAKNFEIPQNRERAFMVSIKGNYSYTFKKYLGLKYRLKDMLEDSTEEKYYLSDKMIDCFMSDGTSKYPRRDRFLSNINRKNQDIGNAITTIAGSRPTDNYVVENKIEEKYFLSNKMIEYISANNDKWTGNNIKSLVNKSIASTINTAEGARRCDSSNYIAYGLPENADLKSILKDKSLFTETQAKMFTPEGDVKRYIDSDVVDKFKEGQIADISFPNGYNKGNRVFDECPTINTTTTSSSFCVKVPLKRGYDVEIKVEKDDTDEIDIIGNYSKSDYNATPIVGKNGVTPTIRENHGEVTAIMVEDKKGNKFSLAGDNKQLRETIENNEFKINEVKAMDLYNRSTREGIMQTVDTGYHNTQRLFDGLRIRKLTPKECFRLMGVREDDFENVSKNQSNSSLYHLAGDSIVTTCLMAIFGELLDVDYETKINELVEKIKEK